MGQLFSASKHTTSSLGLTRKIKVNFPDSSSEVSHHHHHPPTPSDDDLPLLKNAKGHYWYPVNGPKILDACGGAGVACLGHGRKDIVKAATKQMKAYQYASYAHFKLDPVLELSRFLTCSTGGKMQKVYLMCSGSEATEASLKLSIEYFQWINQPQRVNFIARHDSYHGTTLNSLSASGHHAHHLPFLSSILSHQRNFHHIPPFNAYRQQLPSESDSEFVTRKLAELENEFLRLGPETVAAVLLKPVVGAAMGCVPALPGYLPGVKSLCRKYGALLIFDEVMCGMGRTGSLHAWGFEADGEGATPDLRTIAKGFGGGYVPASALLVGKQIAGAVEEQGRVFTHGHTYQDHPVAAAAAMQVQRVIREEKLVENVGQMGELLGRRLKEEIGGHKNVGHVRGRGLFWGVEFVKDKMGKETLEPEERVAQRVWKVCVKKFGVLVYAGQGCAGGGRGDHVMIMPAYDVNGKEVEEIVTRVKGAVEVVFGK
ncbi:putative aminotransferase YodT [Cladorrhinum sp. PSN332]|nr:putative aminotransferase YodT [Cladorrhinum sp. PSN332]